MLTGTAIQAQGKNLSFWKGLFRNYIGYIVSGSVAYLGFIWILKDKNRQGWHDMMVDSIVVVKNKMMIWVGVAVLLGVYYLNYVQINLIVSKVFLLISNFK